MGYPSSGSPQTTTPLYFSVRYYAGFVQDDIRVSNRLTVNVGVRYEYETGIGERNNHVLVGFDQAAINPIAQGLAGSTVTPRGVMQFAGVGGNRTREGSPLRDKFGP